MAEKSRDAFRTISEVADWLNVPTHVLRFWESRFAQIKPVKRAGGRRYYRPSDMRVIGGVKVLLHDQGMTIRGVQKLFREEGIKHVSGFAPPLFDLDETLETAPPLDEAALQRAVQPAGAARSTADAAPDPIIEVEDAVAPPDAVTEEVPPLFRHATANEVEDPTKPAAETEPTLETEAEDAPIAPVIPATPDVPESDPADDAGQHAKPAGIAARLKLVDPAFLAPHRDTLEETAHQLRAVLKRAS